MINDGIPVAMFAAHCPLQIGFVPQANFFIESLTVAETMRGAARLRIPQTVERSEKDRRADQVIDDLNLTHRAHSMIEQLSGGERKRCSIGIELVSAPPLLFLDEPTSGLDSHNAANLLTKLHDLAARGHTVVTTLHQPSARMMAQANKVLLLSAGRVVYFGPVSHVVAYFSRLGAEINVVGNPFDTLLLLIHTESEGDEKKIIHLSHVWKQWYETGQFPQSDGSGQKQWPRRAVRMLRRVRNSIADAHAAGAHAIGRNHAENSYRAESSAANQQAVDGAMIRRGHEDDDPKAFAPTNVDFEDRSVPGMSWCGEFGLLMRRHGLQSLRTPKALQLRLFQALFMAVLVSLVFMQIGDTQASIQSRNGALFFLVRMRIHVHVHVHFDMHMRDLIFNIYIRILIIIIRIHI